jgi:hypothetical protein
LEVIYDFDIRVAKFQGGEEIFFSAEAELTSLSVKKTWVRPPITLDFQVCSKKLMIGYYVCGLWFSSSIFENI